MSEKSKRDQGTARLEELMAKKGQEPPWDILLTEWSDRSDTNRREQNGGIRSAPFFRHFLDRRKSQDRRWSW